MLTKSRQTRGPSQSLWHSVVVISLVATLLVALLISRSAEAQSFNSGSNGEDGALDFSGTPPGTTIEFNPAAFTPPLDRDRDNIYHFTTITIPAGVTVRLTARFLDGPVFWLATGLVSVNGTISLDGSNGSGLTTLPSQRLVSIPGAGGFAGGIGGNFNSTPAAPAQPGSGPSGGAPRTIGSGSGIGGSFSGNRFLVPLVGGSGGAGGNAGGIDVWGGTGGAGGGAILIASSGTITINGSVSANGGRGGSGGFQNNGSGGGGGGGAIRIVGNTVSGSGILSAVAGLSPGFQSNGGFGFIRVEAFTYQFSNNFNGTSFALASPSPLFLPSTPAPSVRAVSIAGVPVPVDPGGSFVTPDVTIDQATPATISIEAKFVPPGTIVRVHIFSENGGDQIIDSAPLAGTLAQSATTASVTFPPGFSRGFVRAVWR